MYDLRYEKFVWQISTSSILFDREVLLSSHIIIIMISLIIVTISIDDLLTKIIIPTKNRFRISIKACFEKLALLVVGS